MLVILLLVAILLIAVIAYVALGRDRFAVAWDALPGPVKTVLNVFVAGGLAVILGAVISAKGVTGVDWQAIGLDALNAAFLGVAVAVLRWLNPVDDAYGLGQAEVDSAEVGEH